jgi:hypothetical protein
LVVPHPRFDGFAVLLRKLPRERTQFVGIFGKQRHHHRRLAGEASAPVDYGSAADLA